MLSGSGPGGSQQESTDAITDPGYLLHGPSCLFQILQIYITDNTEMNINHSCIKPNLELVMELYELTGINNSRVSDHFRTQVR